jgi:hypothetical protein
LSSAEAVEKDGEHCPEFSDRHLPEQTKLFELEAVASDALALHYNTIREISVICG